jgi:hypothetical protein
VLYKGIGFDDPLSRLCTTLRIDSAVQAFSSIVGEWFLGDWLDARTRHNRNTKPSATPYYGQAAGFTRAVLD